MIPAILAVALLCQPVPTAHVRAALSPVGLSGRPEAATVASGTASWLRYRHGHAAAGPALRAALGRGWRGTRVTVCGRGCASVVLSGWMRSADKLVDLDASDFRAVCGPLRRGVCRVTVQP